MIFPPTVRGSGTRLKRVKEELLNFFLFFEYGGYQNAPAPVKGEKVSLKIQRADLIDR